MSSLQNSAGRAQAKSRGAFGTVGWLMLLLGMATVLVPPTASATVLADPLGDFLSPSYIGPQNSDLDIVSGFANYASGYVELSLTMDSVIGSSTATPYYLWGVNRGSGTDRLVTSGPPAVGPSTILLDAVVRFDYDGNGRVVTFASAFSPPVVTLLDPSDINIFGDTVSAQIPWSLLPSTGFTTAQYTYIAWTRSALGSQAFIADLAPDDASILAVPEPASLALMAVGLLASGFASRGRRARTMSASARATTLRGRCRGAHRGARARRSERLLRYCARPFSLERLREIDTEHLVYVSVKPGPGGSVSLMLTPRQLLDRLAVLIPPPRKHRHRYYGVLALATAVRCHRTDPSH